MTDNINDLFTKYGIKRYPFPRTSATQNIEPNTKIESPQLGKVNPLESIDIVKIETTS